MLLYTFIHLSPGWEISSRLKDNKRDQEKDQCDGLRVRHLSFSSNRLICISRFVIQCCHLQVHNFGSANWSQDSWLLSVFGVLLSQ